MLMNKTTKNRTGDQYAYYAGTYCRDWLGDILGLSNTRWLENKKLSVKSEQNVKNIACNSVEAFQNFDYKSRTAVLNVIEEDQIVFHMNVKNKFGTDMMQHQQKLLDCPSFLQVRALKAGEEYIPPPQKNTPVDMVALAASVSEEAAQPLS